MLQTATGSFSAQSVAKRQKIQNKKCTDKAAADDDNIETAADNRKSAADLSTTTQSEQIEIPQWGAADKSWDALPLERKIHIYDLLVMIITKKPKGQTIKDIIKASVCMPENTYYRWKGGKIDALRAAIEVDPKLGHLQRIGFDWRKYIPPDEEITITEEAEANVLQQEAKDNAKLTLAALKEHVPSNSTVIDGTNGLGIYLSDKETKELYTCILVDKYKNEVQNTDKYQGVLSYNCEEFRQYMTIRVAMAFIWDPPYRTINGGHTIVNCTITKSQTRIRFNSSYGVEYKYTNEMINAMYSRGFYWANKVLHDDGVFLVKCMHENNAFDQQQAIIEMANIYNFRVKGVYTLKSKSSTGKDSYLYVMMRKRTRVKEGKKSSIKTIQSLQDMYCTASEAAEYKQTMTRKINNRAATAYLRATTTSLYNGELWADACEKLQKGLTEEQRRKAYEDIREDIIDSFNSFQTKDTEIRQELTLRNGNNNEWCWEDLQSLALTSQQIFLDIKNVAGLLFEQHLHQRNVCIEDKRTLQTKQKLELRLIGKKIGLVNNDSHFSLSCNIQLLRDEKNEKNKDKDRQS